MERLLVRSGHFCKIGCAAVGFAGVAKWQTHRT